MDRYCQYTLYYLISYWSLSKNVFECSCAKLQLKLLQQFLPRLKHLLGFSDHSMQWEACIVELKNQCASL